MPDIINLKAVATLEDFSNALNALEHLNHEVLGMTSFKLGGDAINRVTTELSEDVSKMPRLVCTEVPKGARDSDLAAATTAKDKADIREAFLTFASDILMNQDAVSYEEVALGLDTDPKKTITEVLITRQAPPLPPSSAKREKPGDSALKAPPPGDSSETFRTFMPFIFAWEGRTFENDPDDPGGATKFGIDQRSHPNVDIKNLTEELALAIYWEEWKDDGCPGLPRPYAEVFFNCAVNMGKGRANGFHGVAKGNASVFLGLQEGYYQRLAQQDRFKKYLKGWLNRTKALRDRFGIPR
ncbi:glycosyl hydrolase 108 family protein [Prosthecobacter sp.]|uniref:glycosyl hydrolase 108 family protein n=1 Tax=Prosthecobacter sp. TaxID=1965333 RepID=UPI003783FB65